MNSSDEPGKLFVGGLSWETTQDNLQAYFSRFGEVVDSVVMKNSETGRSRGFGFVTFKDPDCLTLVLTSGPHELDGRTIDPKSCNPRGATKSAGGGGGGGSGGGSGGGGGGGFKSKRGDNFPKVFLGGLPTVCTETDLRNFFSKYGKVVEVVIMYDQERKKSRGFGFLSFESDDCIDRVCAEHYVNINGKQVECKRAEPREASRSRGGNAGGGGGGYQGGGGGGGSMQNNQWGAGPNMMSGPTGWGSGPMGGAPGTPSGPPGGGAPMPNGMMAGYQGGWGAPQQQQGAYQGYGTNYQGWGTTPTSYAGYGQTGTQYPQQQGYQGYGFGGYSGFGTTPAVAGGQQPPGAQGATDPYATGGPPGMPVVAGAQAANTGAMGSYQQETSSYGPARGYGAAAGDSMGGAAANPYGAGNQTAGAGYSAGGYNQGAGGAAVGAQAGGRGQAQTYHPYRR